jgi:hypothetical protein
VRSPSGGSGPAPVLVAGLLAVAAADALGDLARSVLLIGVDRTLHGLGAGVCLAAAAGIVAERRQASRSLVGWWACATVCGLAATPALMRHRVIADGWHAALQAYPWLAGVALALAALYTILAEGTAPLAVRIAFPPAERALVALLAAPVAGMCAIAVAVTDRGGQAVAVAAIAGAIGVTGLSVLAGKASTAGRLAGVCAVTGFTVVPAAEAVTTIVPAAELGPKVGVALAAAAACGAALVLARPGTGRRGTAAGLFVAAAAFDAFYLAGGAITHAEVLALVGAPLAGGMTAALAAAWRSTGTGGAVCGVVLLLTGVVGGYVAVAAVQLQALRGARTSVAVHAALVSTTAHWALISAGLTGVLALLTAAGPARRRSGGPGGTPDRG